MLLVGFSDFFQPEKFAALANLGLLFPVFRIVNLGFLLFWLLFRSKYAIIPFLDATELCDSSVDCHSSHDRDNSVSLLASIYIEDCLESASHNSYFFVRCKIKL